MTDAGPLDVDAVVFDVGGVFVVPRPDLVSAAVPSTAGRPEGEFVRAHHHGIAAYDRSGDAPERWPAYHLAYLAALGVDPEPRWVAALDELWHATPSRRLWTHPVVANVAALARLVDAGVPAAIVSNADGHIAEVLADATIAQVGPGAGTMVAVIVDSGIVGILKPDPAIFAHAVEPLGLDPQRCAYVGDSHRNDVEGSAAAGLVPVHLDPEGLGPGGPHRSVRSVDEVVDAVLAAR